VSLPTLPTTGSVRCTSCAITLVSGASLTRGSVRSQRGIGFWASTCGAWYTVYVPSCRACLPRRKGHIVNTASMAGLQPGASPTYDASKHAVVALSEDLYLILHQMQAPVGVSVLCPGWVRTNILDAERNWSCSLGTRPDRDVVADVVFPHVQRAVDEGTNPAVVVRRSGPRGAHIAVNRAPLVCRIVSTETPLARIAQYALHARPPRCRPRWRHGVDRGQGPGAVRQRAGRAGASADTGAIHLFDPAGPRLATSMR
jgi:NAD(P)-dependent dehydrogenase (short-subunit alcohol dehydrogenase family)